MKAIPEISLIKRKVLPVLYKHDIKKAAIFGSYARNEAKVRSDIDFLIEFNGRNKSLFDLVDLKTDLEETLGKKVDLVTYKSINPKLRNSILSEQVIIL